MVSKFIAILALLIWLMVYTPISVLADIPDEATVSFGATPTHIRLGECTTVHWNTDQVREVYYNSKAVSGIDQTRVECPRETTTYQLMVVGQDGNRSTYFTQIVVDQDLPMVSDPNASLTFLVDPTAINAGECVRVFWHAINVREIYYDDQGVPGENQSRVDCPQTAAVYRIRIVRHDGSEEARQIKIRVNNGPVGAERYDEITLFDTNEINFDNRVTVSQDEDDFVWQWRGGEAGNFQAVDDDDDLRLAAIHRSDERSFQSWSQGQCGQAIDQVVIRAVTLLEDMIVCFRTDEGIYGKFQVDDIRSTTGRLRLRGIVWQ